MGSLFDLATLERRLFLFVEGSATLKTQAVRLLSEALVRGEIERGEAARITGLPEGSGRRVLRDTIAAGLLASDTLKGPVSLRFPTSALETLFPKLYRRLDLLDCKSVLASEFERPITMIIQSLTIKLDVTRCGEGFDRLSSMLR